MIEYAPLNDARHTLNGAGPRSSPDTESPLPLFPELPPAAPYPLEALGKVLGRAAVSIARKVQVPAAVAGQSVLAAAALAAQAHADVQLPFGQKRPLSLSLATVLESGGRKTTADREALWPVRKREEALHDIYTNERQTWAIATAAWGAEKRKIEGDKGLEYAARKDALRDLGPEPMPPLLPFLVAPDPTIEGLIKAWVNAPASLGLFSAEGGQFVGGHGMSQESRLRTAAGFSEAWDGATIKRIRAVDGVTILRGRRLSAHVMIQPAAAAQFLADPVLRDQGLLSRFLVAAPTSLTGTRVFTEPLVEDEAAIRAYGARILSLLEAPWPLAVDRAQGLEPRALILSARAAAAWRGFYDEVEAGCGPTGPLSTIRDLAAKAAEHAARIAGVMTIMDSVNAIEIAEREMEDATHLVSWYLTEAVRLNASNLTDPALLRAQALLSWLQARPAPETQLRDILRFGPSPTRTKAAAEKAIEVLHGHGWTQDASSRPRAIRLNGWEAAHG